MTDIVKIKKGLECCLSPVTMCASCPYGVRNCLDMKRDMFDLLNEQQAPVEPFRKDGFHYYCGVCGLRLSSKRKQRFCHGCGRAVDWFEK